MLSPLVGIGLGSAVAGGCFYAALKGLFGASAEAEAAKVKADVLAEVDKLDASASADAKKLAADIKAKL